MSWNEICSLTFLPHVVRFLCLVCSQWFAWTVLWPFCASNQNLIFSSCPWLSSSLSSSPGCLSLYSYPIAGQLNPGTHAKDPVATVRMLRYRLMHKKKNVELYFKHLGAFQVSCEEDLADYSNSRQQVSRPFYRLWWELSGKNKSTASLWPWLLCTKRYHQHATITKRACWCLAGIMFPMLFTILVERVSMLTFVNWL